MYQIASSWTVAYELTVLGTAMYVRLSPVDWPADRLCRVQIFFASRVYLGMRICYVQKIRPLTTTIFL